MTGLLEVVDPRPLIEPDCFSWRDLPSDGDTQPFIREMHEVWKAQVAWARFTIISDEFPNDPYPHGLYFEGWSKWPWEHDPPGEAAPFNYPLTAIVPAPNPRTSSHDT